MYRGPSWNVTGPTWSVAGPVPNATCGRVRSHHACCIRIRLAGAEITAAGATAGHGGERQEAMSGPIVRWLHRHDPEWNALHKAIKVAFAVTVGLAIGTLVIGNSQFSTFASSAESPCCCSPSSPAVVGAIRCVVGLALIGAVLIILGTLASVVAWLAVLGMAVVGFIVLFAGLFSAAAAGATRAALLAYILPVQPPGRGGHSGPAGWLGHGGDAGGSAGDPGVAAARSRPVAGAGVGGLRGHVRPVAGALGTLPIRVRGDADERARSLQLIDGTPKQAILALRQQFRSTIYRPVGLTTGSRMLMQLPDRLAWLRSVIDRIPRGDTDGWPEPTKQLVWPAPTCSAPARRSWRPPTVRRRRPAATDRGAAGPRSATAPRSARSWRSSADRPHEQDPDLLLPALAHELAYTPTWPGRRSRCRRPPMPDR